MSSTSKNIVAELKKSEKLNGDNYNIWHHKIQYILIEQEILEALNNTLAEPSMAILLNIEGISRPTRFGKGIIAMLA